MSSTSRGISRRDKRAGAGYSRSRWNATKHGLAGDRVVIAGEDPEEFDRLLLEYIDEWEPRGRTQERLVEELAAIDWKLTRYARVEQAYHRQATLPCATTTSRDQAEAVATAWPKHRAKEDLGAAKKGGNGWRYGILILGGIG